MAFDGTVRSLDVDGRLHLSKTHISKATVNPYYGSEIPGAEKLGLDKFKVYYLFRDPIELARSASTFARLPILAKHVPISADDHPAELVVGAIGSDVEFNDPYLDADVCIWDSAAIAGIETETVREFSCAYRYTPVMTPGEFHGQRYDGVMTEIHGNHLALVEAGRAGSDVMAADEAIKTMKTTKLGKALLVTLGAMSPKLAQDSAFASLVAMASKKTFNAEEVSSKLIAMDATLDPKRIAVTFDALLALDDNNGATVPSADEDESEEDKKKRLAKDKVAKDAEEKDEKDKVAKDAEEKDEKDKKAMDAAIVTIKRDMREANEARTAVRTIVGDVLAMDSAEEIYCFALDQMKVDHKDVKGTPAIKALFTVASSKSTSPAPKVAMDSKSLAAQFPQAMRFRSV
jgi:hypothetical protein